jgi:hypothetical protein
MLITSCSEVVKDNMKSIFKEIYRLLTTFVTFIVVLVGVIFFSKFKLSFKNKEVLNKSRCAIIGNGPSLNSDIEKILRLENTDYICVNHFADSEWFEQLKPQRYLFIDPYFWSDDADKTLIDKREKTFKFINSKTDWPLVIYLPIMANMQYLKKNINNKNIEFRQYNSIGHENFKGNLAYKFFDLGLCAPLGMNVLIHAVFIGIRIGYKEVMIYGADTSFHEMIRVDQNSNEFYREATHFYGVDRELIYTDASKTTPSNMAHEFRCLANTFSSYDILSKYAKSKNIDVFNCSSFSWIDSFKRK